MALEIISFARSNFVATVRMSAEEKWGACENRPDFPHSNLIKSLHLLNFLLPFLGGRLVPGADFWRGPNVPPI